MAIVKHMAVLFLLAAASLAQTTIKGGAKLAGGVAPGSSQTRRGYIYTVFPPGTGSADYTNFRANVMTSSLMDGVTLQLNVSDFAQKNGTVFYVPSTTGVGNCAGFTPTTPDTQLCTKIFPPGGTLPIYYPWEWGRIDQTNTPGVNSWFQDFGTGRKTVNLLDFSQASSSTANTSTPSYVTVSDYVNLFSPARQDALNTLTTTNPCAGNNWAGTSGTAASRSGSTLVTVTSTAHKLNTNDSIWVSATAGSGTFSQYNSLSASTTITVTDADHFTYTVGTSATDTATITYIAASQSYLVPYELPYLTYRQAAIKALMLHFGASYTNALGGTASQLGYFRAGQSAGGEVYPFCYAAMQALAAPYQFTTNQTGSSPGTGDNCYVGGGCTTWDWNTYYNNDLLFLESLHPYMRLFTSLNVGGTGASPRFSFARGQVSKAAARTNGAMLFDGIGEQGVSLADITAYAANTAQTFTDPNPANVCGNDGCKLAMTYTASGMPIEIQQISTSKYDDSNCSSCGVPPNDSGDMRQWLAFFTGLSATDGTATVTLPGRASVLELYYRDAALALDASTYCSLDNATNPTSCASGIVLPSFAWYTAAYRYAAFQAVGMGTTCATSYGTTAQGTGASGNCSYALALKNFHGSH